MPAPEIERKFVVERVPEWVSAARAEKLDQGYLAIEELGGEVRVRRVADRSWITAKRGLGLVREEFEVELSPQQFVALWPATLGRRIEKHRRCLVLDGSTVVVDSYSGALEGLTVAEVEFDSLEASADFAVPEWFGREVTGIRRYANQHLAVFGDPTDFDRPSPRR